MPSYGFRSFPQHAPGALAAAAALLIAGLGPAQQPNQIPTEIPFAPPADNFTVLDFAGGMTLLRNPANDLGFFGGMGSAIFVLILSSATHGVITDARWERIPPLTPPPSLPQAAFFTHFLTGGAQRLSKVVWNSPQPILPTAVFPTLPAATPAGTGRWHLDTVDSTNAIFFLHDTGNRVLRVDTTTLTSAVLFTMTEPVSSIAISPDDSKVAVQGTNGLLIARPATGGAVTNSTTGALGSRPPCWLDNQFVAFIALNGVANSIMRLDTTNAVPPVPLTLAPVAVDAASGMDVSDDNLWLTFVVSQSINGFPERVAAAMLVRNGPTGASGPGGAYVVLGDYRNAFTAPPTALTNWAAINTPMIHHNPNLPPGSGSVLINYIGRKNPTVPTLKFFLVEVRDEVLVTPRAQPGTSVTFSSVAVPFGGLWGVFVSFGRLPAPVSISGFLNTQLIDNPQSLLSVATTSSMPVAVTLTLPNDPFLIGLRLLLQGASLASQPSQPILSTVAEWPIF